MNEKAMELFGNEEFLAKIENLGSLDEVKKAFSEEGVTLDLDVMKAAVNIGDAELSEGELEDVAGGGFISTVWNVTKAVSIIGRTLYDDARGQKRAYTTKQVMWAINYIG